MSASSPKASSTTAVDILPVADPDHDHNQLAISDGVDDAIVTDPNSVVILFAAEFQYSLRPRVEAQRIDAGRDALLNFLGKLGELLSCRWKELYLIARFRSCSHSLESQFGLHLIPGDGTFAFELL
jgi:hypothetical protein